MQPNQELIIRYLNGTASQADRLEVEQWVATSKENSAELNDLKSIWSATSSNCNFQPCLVTAWEKIKGKTVDKAEFNIDKNWKISSVFKYAAVIALTVVSAIAFYTFEDTNNSVSEAKQLVANEAEQEVKFVILPDQSKVWLKAGAKITYAQDFNPRMVFLEGVAYFEVQPSKALSTFVVNTKHLDVAVVGTKFIVDSQEKSTQVMVEEGKVNVLTSEKKSAALTANQMTTYDQENIDLQVMTISDANYLAWKTGILRFDAQKLSEVIEALQMHYNVKIYLKNNEIKNCLVTANFDNNNIDEVIYTIKSILGLKVSRSADEAFLLSGTGCKPKV